jgi:Fe-S-cluster containining protein
MGQHDDAPVNVTQLPPGKRFRFRCHPEVDCFTECCRMLELVLTPYDLLRMRYATGLTSQQLLDRHVILEQEPGEPFPRLYLGMVDDGRASCIFVAKTGCTIYPHRPGACRTYPLGRGVRCRRNGEIAEQYVLLQEPHCHGYREENLQDIAEYIADQELAAYHRSNDKVAAILQHEAIKSGFVPSAKQIEFFLLALYNLDTFRDKLRNGQLTEYQARTPGPAPFADDEDLLDYGIELVARELFHRIPLLRAAPPQGA